MTVSIKKILYITLASVLITVLGCGDDTSVPTGPGSNSDNADDYATLTYTLLREDGTPVPEAEIWLSGGAKLVLSNTDSSGIAFFDSLAAGIYELHSGIDDANWVNYFTLHSGDDIAHTSIIPSTTDMEVFVWIEIDNGMIPLADADVILEPGSLHQTTDSDGRVVFEDIQLQRIKVQISFYDLTETYSFGIGFENDKPRVVSIVLLNYAGTKELLTIQGPDECTFNLYDSPLILNTVTTDFSKEQIPDEDIVWLSDRAGVLGFGSELVIDYLPLGTHHITAREKKRPYSTKTDTITLHVYADSDQSYFPLTDGSEWMYAIDPESYTVVGDEEYEEVWTFSDCSVSVDEKGFFSGSLSGVVETHQTVKDASYTFIDQYTVQASAIFLKSRKEIKKTTDRQSGVMEQTTITTTYHPHINILENAFEAGGTPSLSQTVTATVEMKYSRNGNGTLTRIENQVCHVSSVYGSPEVLDTPYGMLDVIPITISDHSGSRSISVAKDMGIVATAFSPFGFPIEGVLTQTNVLDIEVLEQP